MTPVGVRSAYRRMLGQFELVFLRKYTGVGALRTKRDYAVQARVLNYNEEEFVGQVQEGDRKLIIMAEDVDASSLRLPIRKGDKVVIEREGDKELNIEGSDDNTRRIGGELIAYEIRARG